MNAHTPKQAAGWDAKRARLETYFDRTALDAWAAMTSDAPVSKIRATVRAGRQEMRDTLLSWLPQDLSGRRILDAGCGTGMLAIEVARRGGDVVGIDVSPQLIEIGKERLPEDVKGKISLHAGDMLDAGFGDFDHIVSMDVLIHYESDQIAAATAKLAERTRHSMLFTFAPGTPLLRTARAIGQFFPKSDRSPSIIPVAHDLLKARLSRSVPQAKLGRDQRISRGFYTSHAQEVLLG
ncbi:magnesium protoporphyrin IX methyltransferase [Sandarakinorhabdus limnophila]|jgi:magnesium-protoporphyrin O-methyltransferase|uniref:magnesium protoporphyrin IX methyltransferase n=1 Tax=Sandarakinorhabdus limnophila TaxID=210512 RepID=UPI0026EEFAED|nr:magnesium protoporphyrin IX methyltransferase [Sandarakinorhabdus limnophila]MCM0032974.1 magnesium protoporphyrin IX methyltransferase [Sandarakinorhabdus limnophila]